MDGNEKGDSFKNKVDYSECGVLNLSLKTFEKILDRKTLI